MKIIILITSVLGIIFLLIHEFDAIYEEEWRMFKFLRRLPERTQYLIFLYSHIPILLFVFYYVWHVFHFTGKPIWLFLNAFGIVHFLLHWYATKWESNVFHRFSSFIFIGAYALTGFINLLLYSYYEY